VANQLGFHISVSRGILQAEAEGVKNPRTDLLSSESAISYTLGVAEHQHARAKCSSGLSSWNLGPRPCSCTLFGTVWRKYALKSLWFHSVARLTPRLVPFPKSALDFRNPPQTDLWTPADLPIATVGTHPRFIFCLEHKLGACKCFEADYRRSELIWSLGGIYVVYVFFVLNVKRFRVPDA